MQYRVFIQTNEEQYLGALVAAYALRRNSRHADQFEVELLHYKNFPWLHAKEGQKFLRGLEQRVWTNDDLQSFTPLRFAPPKLMNYSGRSVVIDPDCFAVGDVWDLLSRDMQGKALMCRVRPPLKEMPAYRASSVMLLDNARLTHWDAERTFNELFEFKVDYLKLVKLQYEADETVGKLESERNDFDHLGPATKILHTTYRRTQPWKTGLPIDFTVRVKPKSMLKQLKNLIAPKQPKSETYLPHPDPNQERLFFGLLAECLEKGLVTEDLVRREMSANHVRHDALELCSRAAA
jgi:hypothetical protein